MNTVAGYDPMRVEQSVRAFADAMLETMRKHERKGGWDNVDSRWLAWKLAEEHAEVVTAISDYVLYGTPFNRRALAAELVDVANVAMMLWDKLQTEG